MTSDRAREIPIVRKNAYLKETKGLRKDYSLWNLGDL